MSTVIGFECRDGAVVAGDRVVTGNGSQIVSDTFERVFDHGDVGAAVVGVAEANVADNADGRGSVEAFDGEFEAALREYRFDHDDVGFAPALRMAASVADEANADAIVAARDDAGVARIGTAYGDGGTLEHDATALGSGGGPALGRLDALDRDVGLDEAASLARDVLGTVAERDPGTGAEADVWTLDSASGE